MQVEPAATKSTAATAMRTMRIVHLVLCGAIVMYIYLAEAIIRPTNKVAPPSMVEGLSVVCLATVIIGFLARRRMLQPAIDGIQRGDATALQRWLKANILCMALAVSVSLYGVGLRAIGGSPQVTLPFFAAALVLMWLWRPRPIDAELTGMDGKA